MPKRIKALQSHRMRRMSCGGCHTLLLTSANAVLACGSGGMGRTGLGTRETTTVPRLVEALSSHAVIQVSAGLSH